MNKKEVKSRLNKLGIKPSENTPYFYINNLREVRKSSWSPFKDSWDLGRLEDGNVYLSEEEAEQALKSLPRKKGAADWSEPSFWSECPYCENDQDLWEQLKKMDVPFRPYESYDEEQCAGVEFTCEECENEFELDCISY